MWLGEDMSSVDELLRIMATLRDPESGCAWDLKQTFDTIVPYTVEEAFEVAEAIAERDWSELREELGDLLLQVVFHSRMAEEQGLFDFHQVVEVLNDKLLRRHPHVFGDQQGASLDEIKHTWEVIKAEERDAKGRAHQSALDGVPAGLPALQRAAKLQKKASKVGFDWSHLEGVVAQLDAEISELRQAIESGEAAAIEDELGDVLFSVINVSRHLKLDADLALRRASDKFSRRFREVEALAEEGGNALSELDEAALDQLWQRAKQRLLDGNHSS